MAMTRITIEDGQKPTKAQLKEIREAAKMPEVYESDYPPSSPKALAEFAAKARALRIFGRLCGTLRCSTGGLMFQRPYEGV